MPALVLAAYGMFVSFSLLLGNEWPVSQLFREDDGYFLMTIARNLARGLGPTFDKIHETNGFHPLWVLVLTAFFKAASPLASDSFLLRRVAGALSLVITLLAWGWCLRWLRTIGASHGDRLVAITLLVSMLGAGFYGLETPLLALMLVAHLASAWELWKAADSRRALMFGVTAALLILTRFDTVVIVAVLALGLAVSHLVRGRSVITALSIVLTALVPIVMLVGGYLAMSVIRFGHAFPISALVLFRAPGVNFAGLESLSATDMWAYPIACAFGGLAIAGALGEGRALGIPHVAADRVGFGAVLGLAAVTLLIIQVLFQRSVFGWHLAAPLMVAITGGTVCVPSRAIARQGRAPLRAALAALALVVAVSLIVSGASAPDDHDDSVKFLELASSQLRDQSPAFRVDGSGVLGWFCDCRLVNGDGVVNNREYLHDFLTPRRIRDYLDREGIRWVIVDTEQGAIDGRVWFDAWDWQTLSSYPVMSFPADAAAVHVGAEWLFPYPGPSR